MYQSCGVCVSLPLPLGDVRFLPPDRVLRLLDLVARGAARTTRTSTPQSFVHGNPSFTPHPLPSRCPLALMVQKPSHGKNDEAEQRRMDDALRLSNIDVLIEAFRAGLNLNSIIPTDTASEAQAFRAGRELGRAVGSSGAAAGSSGGTGSQSVIAVGPAAPQVPLSRLRACRRCGRENPGHLGRDCPGPYLVQNPPAPSVPASSHPDAAFYALFQPVLEQGVVFGTWRQVLDAYGVTVRGKRVSSEAEGRQWLFDHRHEAASLLPVRYL